MTPQSPTFSKTPLFEGRAGGYELYRIPGIVATARGALLAYVEARQSARGDWGAIDILMRRSADGGATWSAPHKIVDLGYRLPKNPVALEKGLAGADEQTFNNPVAIVARQTGAVHFLFCAEYCRCFYMRSDNDGLTFTRPVEITTTFDAFRPEYDWRVLATGPGHGIQLDKGRLLVPVWLSEGTGSHAHRPSCVATIYSDDHGATWKRGEIVVRDSEQFANPSETVALQLTDGRVMLNIRSEASEHRRLVSCSADGARGWSTPVFDEALFEPICFAALERLSGPPKPRILFVNPDSSALGASPNDPRGWRRENLTLRLSYDEGQTWPIARVIDPDIAGYADLAVGPDGAIYCLYEGGGIGGNMYHCTHVTLARLNLEWLSAGRDSLEGQG